MCERMGLARYANSGKLVELEHELPEDLALEPKLHYLAFGESASQLRLVHGFEFEFEDD